VGKILGQGGENVKRLQEMAGCRIAVLGRGSMKDKNKVRIIAADNETLAFCVWSCWNFKPFLFIWAAYWCSWLGVGLLIKRLQFQFPVGCSGNWTTRGYANSRTGHLADWSTRALVNLWTGQVADWTTCGLADAAKRTKT